MSQNHVIPRQIEKIGPMAFAGGPKTVTATVQKIGPLAQGAFVVEGDVEMWLIQGVASVIDAMNGATGPTQTDMNNIGRRVPPKTELEFIVGSVTNATDKTDGYIYWCKVVGAADGANFRCNDISKSKEV